MTSRWGPPLGDENTSRWNSKAAKHTQKQTDWACTVWREWLDILCQIQVYWREVEANNIRCAK